MLAVQAGRRRNYPETMEWLRIATTCGDVMSEATAWNMLRAVYDNEDGFSGVAPQNTAAAAECTARCCTMLLRASLAGALSTAELRDEFLWVVKLCTDYVVRGTVKPNSDEWSAVVSALRAVVAAYEKSPDQEHAAAAVVALSGVAHSEYTMGDLDHAARYIRRLLAVAQRAGGFADEDVNKHVSITKANLAVFEATTPEEHALAVQHAKLLMSSCPTGFRCESFPTQVPMAMERPACSTCGKQPLTLKVCGGTCGGAVRYCDAACHAVHIRQHMRESGCKKRK